METTLRVTTLHSGRKRKLVLTQERSLDDGRTRNTHGHGHPDDRYRVGDLLFVEILKGYRQ